MLLFATFAEAAPIESRFAFRALQFTSNFMGKRIGSIDRKKCQVSSFRELTTLRRVVNDAHFLKRIKKEARLHERTKTRDVKEIRARTQLQI